MTFYFTPPYRIPMVDQRAGMYGVTGTPTAVIDGIDVFGGGLPSGSMYSYYQPTVQDRLAVTSPLLIEGTYVMIGDQVDFDATITVESDLGPGSHKLYTLIAQDDFHAHPNFVLETLPTVDLTIATVGQTLGYQQSFTMQPGWTEPALAIILLVQETATGEILQAAKLRPDYAATVAISSYPPSIQAGWELSGPTIEVTGAGEGIFNFFEHGSFTLTWEAIPHWVEPVQNPQTLTVAEDGTIEFVGVYSDGPFVGSTLPPVGDPGSGQAAGMIDFDGDGDLDLHVVNAGSPDQLMRNTGGTFVNVAAGDIADAGAGRGAAWADFTGDGILDVYLPRHGQANRLLIGDGLGGFNPANSIGVDDIGPATAATWVDFNLDGLLDLYVVNDGEANLLLRGFGDLGGGLYLFSSESGAATDAGHGSGAAWTDVDLDGRPDVYVVNQHNPNVLLQNTSYGFVDVTSPAGIGDLGNGMAAAWGDYDNDGDFDLYLANEGSPDFLYRATTPFRYSRVLGANLGDAGNARGVVWVDLDNDMNLDLYVVRNQEPDLMLLGDGNGSFLKVPVGQVGEEGAGNGLAAGDVDRDGAVDLFTTRDGESNALFTNDFDSGNRWLTLKLVGAGTNSAAIGARVVVTAGGVSQSRMVFPGTGWLGNSSLELHFGAAANVLVDQVDIWWPDGTTQTLGPLQTNMRHVITQGANPPSPVLPDGAARVTSLGRAYPNPFNPRTTIEYELARQGRVRLAIFTLEGRLVRTLDEGVRGAGPHRAVWDGTDGQGRRVASGAYFYRLNAPDGFQGTGRVVLVK